MTLLETLQSHKGGLLRIKTELCWYGGRGYDKSPGRICLILDAAAGDARHGPDAARTTTAATVLGTHAAALLLLDGSPHWVWVAEGDVEVISEAR